MPDDSDASLNVPSPMFRKRPCLARAALPASLKEPPLTRRHVEPSIVVVIEKQATGPHGFGQVLLGRRSIFVLELDSRFLRNVQELHRRVLLERRHLHHRNE